MLASVFFHAVQVYRGVALTIRKKTLADFAFLHYCEDCCVTAVSNARLNASLALGAYTCVLSNPSAMGGLSRFVSGKASSLDAFRAYL